MADGNATSERLDISSIGDALQVVKRSAERRALREAWPFVEQAGLGGKRRLYAFDQLPPDVQAAILIKRQPPPEAQAVEVRRTWTEAQLKSAWQQYDRRPDTHKNTAKRRQRALLAVEALVRQQGMGLVQARNVVSAQLQREGVRGGSPATLARWADLVENAPRDSWLPLLLPDYLGRTRTAEMPEAAWDAFKGDWLRLSAPSATSCYERLQRVAKERGWQLPSLRSFERRIEREIPRAVQVLARQGDEALMRTFPAQERDRSVFHALQGVNADGHKFDVFVRFGNGVVARPIMVGVQDLASGKLLGWRVAETESADLARLAFRDVVRRYGIPEKVWLDNGRGFASKMLTGGVANRYRFKVREEDPTGILVALGMEIHWATPYHGQAKPIERAWLDLCDRVARHPAFEGAYTGNKPDAKPENYGSRAVKIEEFLRVLDQEIVAHNARTGRRAKVCAGRSFDQVFNDSYAQAPIRKATEEQLRQMLLAAEAVTANAQDGSLRLQGMGNRYWCEALVAYAGQRLMVRFDPDNLHQAVDAYTLAGNYIGQADCIAAVGFADVQAGKEHARARKQYRRAAKDMLKAENRMDAAAVAAQIPSPPPENLPEPTVITGVFGKRPPQPVAEPARRTGTDNAPSERERRLDNHLEQLWNSQLQRELPRFDD